MIGPISKRPMGASMAPAGRFAGSRVVPPPQAAYRAPVRVQQPLAPVRRGAIKE